MSKEEKEILTKLLFEEYNKTKENSLLDLVKKINEINYSIHCISGGDCVIIAKDGIDATVNHFNELCIEKCKIQHCEDGKIIIKGGL